MSYLFKDQSINEPTFVDFKILGHFLWNGVFNYLCFVSPNPNSCIWLLIRLLLVPILNCVQLAFALFNVCPLKQKVRILPYAAASFLFCKKKGLVVSKGMAELSKISKNLTNCFLTILLGIDWTYCGEFHSSNILLEKIRGKQMIIFHEYGVGGKDFESS